MRHSPQSARLSTPSLSSTAGAIVALVAMTAMLNAAVSASAAAGAPLRGQEARQTLSEGVKVRAAVAIVAAAARKLVETHRLVAALPAQWPSVAAINAIPTAITPVAHSPLIASIQTLSERQLDLPPPTA